MPTPRAVLLASLILCSAGAPATAREPRGGREAPVAAPGPSRGRFLGPHPAPARLGGGFCHIDVPHLHAYLPDRPALYQPVGEAYLFTGDPVPFGYEGPRTVFYGAHPVQLRVEGDLPAAPIYCSLRGPHYHDYAAPAVPDYKVQGGVVFYVGPLPPDYAARRPRLERALEDEYRPFLALRPQVTVAPPPEWQGEVWVPPPAPGVVIAAPPAPGVVVTPPSPPTVVVNAPAAPPVVVATPPRIHFRAPAPSVVVTAPAPPSLIITPPGPPGVIITAPAAPGVIVAPGPHFHPGKHKGWYKGHGHKGGW